MEVDVKMTMKGNTQRQGRCGYSVLPITEIAVRSQTEAIHEKSSRAGANERMGKITPENYMVQTFHSGALSGILFFREQATAEEVAKTISRVVEQCGGDESRLLRVSDSRAFHGQHQLTLNRYYPHWQGYDCCRG
jgi:hypothetical protein